MAKKKNVVVQESKSKSKEDSLFTIIRDSREQDGKGWYFRASQNCHGMEVSALNVGDYTIKGLEDIIMVERKTLGDLWGTLGNQTNYDRFLREMERAKNHRMKYLIVESSVSEVNGGYPFSKVPPALIHARLISLQVKHNLHVIFAGRQDTARGYVRQLFDKLHRYKLEGVI